MSIARTATVTTDISIGIPTDMMDTGTGLTITARTPASAGCSLPW